MEGQIDLHLLPANITYSGSTPQFGTYFRAKDTGTCVDELPLKEASFRGHRLAGITYCGKGTSIRLPEGFSGVLLKRNNNTNKESDKEWDIAGYFTQLSNWNHETAPTKTDGLNRCVEWLQVAKQIHAPVTTGEMEQQM